MRVYHNMRKKDYCVRKAFENIMNTSYQPSGKELLNKIEYQAKQNRRKREEYEKTVRLLRLVNRDRDKERSLG
jgi:hypothetical protein